MSVWLLQASPLIATEQSALAGQPLWLRTCGAACLALVCTLLVGRRVIRWLSRCCPEPLASPSARLNELQHYKQSTPTMGGLFLITSLLIAALVCGDWANGYFRIAILLTLSLASLGTVDDLWKLRTGSRGLTARSKLSAQIAICFAAALQLKPWLESVPNGLTLQLPLLGSSWELGSWFVPLAVLVLVGSSNAVNLTDGLDGLAAGCLVCATCGMGLLAYLVCQPELAAAWHLTSIPGAAEMTILAGAMLGAVVGFLWFNRHPAQVFMGDTGSLPLGGLLGLLAIVSRQELLLVVFGGVFVVEALSVILQVGAFRYCGKRIFRCAPLHHHFQFLGWSERRIVRCFWLASALCVLLGAGLLVSTSVRFGV